MGPPSATRQVWTGERLDGPPLSIELCLSDRITEVFSCASTSHDPTRLQGIEPMVPQMVLVKPGDSNSKTKC